MRISDWSSAVCPSDLGTKAGCLEKVLGGHGGLNNITFGHRRAIPDMREEIATKQRASRFLVEHLSFPTVGHVRRGNETDTLAAEFENLLLGKRPRWAIGEIIDRNVAPERTVHNLRFGC